MLKFTRRLGINFSNQEFDATFYDEYYECDTNPERANEVASTLAKTWLLAQNLMTSNNGKFVAVLQPNSLIDAIDQDYLPVDDAKHNELKKQYEILYLLIKKYAYEFNVNFIDLTQVYEGYEEVYIDFSHVSEFGHSILVKNSRKNLLIGIS